MFFKLVHTLRISFLHRHHRFIDPNYISTPNLKTRSGSNYKQRAISGPNNHYGQYDHQRTTWSSMDNAIIVDNVTISRQRDCHEPRDLSINITKNQMQKVRKILNTMDFRSWWKHLRQDSLANQWRRPLGHLNWPNKVPKRVPCLALGDASPSPWRHLH